MQNVYQPLYPASIRTVAIWSPHPFEDFFSYQNLFQKFLQNFPHLRSLECRYGQSFQTKTLLENADLILLLLDQSADSIREISLYPFLYQKAVFPVVCNYCRFYGPEPEDLVRRLRLRCSYPCVMSERIFRKKEFRIPGTPDSLCVREGRGCYATKSSDMELCRQTFYRLRQTIESMLFRESAGQETISGFPMVRV